MLLADLAEQTWEEIGEPTDTTEEFILNWYQKNLGILNTLLNIDIEFDTETSLADPELLDWQAEVYKQAFVCYFYAKQSRRFLGSNQFSAEDDWTEVREGDTQIKRRSKNEVAKLYLELEKDCRANLKMMADSARMNNAIPVSLSSWHCLERYMRIKKEGDQGL